MHETTNSPDDENNSAAAEGADAPPEVRVLCSVPEVDTATADAGPLWTLAEPGRQLDANLIHLAPGEAIQQHAEHRLDVLLHVVSGYGHVDGHRTTAHAGAGTVLWLPRGATRSITAGEAGMSYLTVHQRRPGLWIGRRAESDPA